MEALINAVYGFEWQMFIPQLAAIASTHDLDCATETGFNEAVEILLMNAKSN